LTTVTTILGLLPMVFQINIDFVTREITHGAPSTQWWVSLASAIVFGLGFASILTLLVTPCALMARENLAAWRAGRQARKNTAAPLPAE
jgi:multidrug efflux pump